MRTSLNLNEALVSEAMRLTGLVTKTALVNEALRQMVAHTKRMALVDMAGKINLSIDLDATRGRVNALPD